MQCSSPRVRYYQVGRLLLKQKKTALTEILTLRAGNTIGYEFHSHIDEFGIQHVVYFISARTHIRIFNRWETVQAKGIKRARCSTFKRSSTSRSAPSASPLTDQTGKPRGQAIGGVLGVVLLGYPVYN